MNEIDLAKCYGLAEHENLFSIGQTLRVRPFPRWASLPFNREKFGGKVREVKPAPSKLVGHPQLVNFGEGFVSGYWMEEIKDAQ